ncbi:MAG: PAS domain S-box protein [Bacteroidetes bacterium]|nr:PAS domain S-box protein [Bacteroidota bacterium]
MTKKLSVLIIEDNENDALLNVHHLTKAGYDVIFERVETAGEMQKYLHKQTWDVILADYKMPQFSVPAALQLLQKTGLDIPFIVVSGDIGEDIAVQMMKEGAHDYLLKNNLTRLASAVEREMKDAVIRHERKQIEQALKDSEEQYRTIFENSIEGIYRSSPEGYFLTVNPSMAKMFGYETPQELMRSINDIEHQIYVNPEKRQQLMMILKKQGLVRGFEIEVYTKDKRKIWILISAFAMKDADGQILFNEGNCIDVTEHKLAEEKIKQQLGELKRWYNVTLKREDRVRELKNEVNQLLERLGESPRYADQDI